MFIVIIIIFFCEEDVVLFPNAVERNFQSFNLSVLQLNFTARVSMTLKRQSVQSFRPQNSPYFLRKPRKRNTRTNGLKQNKWLFPLTVWSRKGGGEELVRLGRKRKIRLKKYDKNWQRKDKRKKTRKKERKKLKSLYYQIRSCWSVTKRQKCSTLKLIYTIKRWKWRNVGI